MKTNWIYCKTAYVQGNILHMRWLQCLWHLESLTAQLRYNFRYNFQLTYKQQKTRLDNYQLTQTNNKQLSKLLQVTSVLSTVVVELQKSMVYSCRKYFFHVFVPDLLIYMIRYVD